MKIRVLGLPLVVLAAVASAACSQPAAAPPAAASPSAAEKVASVQQYAGEINSSLKDIAKTWERYDEHTCMLGAERGDLTCALSPMTLDLAMKTLVMKIDGAQKVGGPSFIGKPPAEIEKLVADTRAAAQAYDDAVGDDAEVDEKMHATVWAHMTRFENLAAAWEPYI